jgi:hypothetical protein
VSAEVTPLRRASDDLRFSSAVALFGMLLRDSHFTGNGNYDTVRELARAALGDDPRGLRAELLRLVSLAQALDPMDPPVALEREESGPEEASNSSAMHATVKRDAY